ncbi:hypothetical protein ACFVYR_20205 [Streptomyces sp. NPDC058284]|uniref:hypothetical protein n=1 Tax=unclassified Streptomyces TaxID=2593676 RepID=UPI003664B633
MSEQMSEQVPASPGADGSTPVPRDPPDQQADSGQDRWEPARESDSGRGERDDVPDTDEAGAGRRGDSGAPEGCANAGGPDREPVPEEPSG